LDSSTANEGTLSDSSALEKASRVVGLGFTGMGIGGGAFRRVCSDWTALLKIR
jgi:hypothetical protein